VAFEGKAAQEGTENSGQPSVVGFYFGAAVASIQTRNCVSNFSAGETIFGVRQLAAAFGVHAFPVSGFPF
jgi:hypothetical protein